MNLEQLLEDVTTRNEDEVNTLRCEKPGWSEAPVIF